MGREKKQMKQQKDEANSYKRMETELMDLKSEYYRFQLYHIITDVRAAKQDIEGADDEINEINDTLKDLEDEIKLKQADLSKSLRKKNKYYQKCQEIERIIK